MYRTSWRIYNTNIAIYRKIFYDNAIKQFHIGVENTDMNYKVFVGQNEYYNIDENIEWISNKQIEISNDENKIEKYIDRVEKGDWTSERKKYIYYNGNI